MSDGISSQGTQLYFVHTLDSDPTIVELTCPTGVSGLGGAADQYDTTCLSNRTSKTSMRGLENPAQVSVPFNMIPDATSQRALFELKRTGSDLKWLLCFSESATAPTTVDSDGAMVPPTDRTCIEFTAYVADLTLDVGGNSIVKGTLLLQRSGDTIEHWKS